ncbi:MAG: hypothetical protein WCB12_13740 [Bryobacteraceae bacterium]
MPSASLARKNWPLFVSAALALLGATVFRVFLNWDALGLTVKLTDLSGLLAPLAFAAAVIERAVEILVSPWRDAEASTLENAMAAIKARPADPAANAQNAAELKAASNALDEYRGNTQRYAFAVSLTLSVLVSIAGVRALGPFVDANKLKDPVFTHGAQYLFFLCVDVVLSAALLAGGADGIHSVVNAVTSFFDGVTSKSRA